MVVLARPRERKGWWEHLKQLHGEIISCLQKVSDSFRSGSCAGKERGRTIIVFFVVVLVAAVPFGEELWLLDPRNSGGPAIWAFICIGVLAAHVQSFSTCVIWRV